MRLMPSSETQKEKHHNLQCNRLVTDQQDRLYNESVFVARLDQTGDRIVELSRRRSEFRESAVQGDWIRNGKKTS
jgi:hypothetical protein